MQHIIEGLIATIGILILIWAIVRILEDGE